MIKLFNQWIQLISFQFKVRVMIYNQKVILIIKDEKNLFKYTFIQNKENDYIR